MNVDVRPTNPCSAEAAVRCFIAIPYLTALVPVSFAVQVAAVSAPSLGDVILSTMLVLALVFACHLFLKLIVRRSPVTEIILTSGIAFVGLFTFPVTLLPVAYQCWIYLALGGACLVMLAFAWRAVSQIPATAFPKRMAIVLAIAIGLQLISAASQILPDAVRMSRSDGDEFLRRSCSAKEELLQTRLAIGLRMPHIYYIVLDAYGRSDVLQQLYELDNSPFLEALEQRGLFVASGARSNYHLTELSIASSLNLDYLNAETLGNFRTRLPFHSLISNSLVVRTLKQHGYLTLAFQTGKSTTECRQFDRYLAPAKGLSDFQDILFHTTALPFFLESVQSRVPYFPSVLHRNRIAETFEALPLVTRETTAPCFVFAHIMAPHPPFVFDELGKARNLRGRYLLADSEPFHAVNDRADYLDGYRRQVQYVNWQVLNMIDRIQSQSSRPAVIVLQADHGPRSRVNVSSLETSDLTEAFAILLAVSRPPGQSPELCDDMTPVNVFRAVFNRCLGTELAVLENRCYFEEPLYSHQFRDVTKATMRVLSDTRQSE